MTLLLLMRHARATWASPGVRDFDRPLDAEGRAEAASIGAAMARRALRPDVVLCSPAVRTVETLIGLGDIATASRMIHPRRLYDGGASDYIEEIAGVRDAETTLLIGHNPMMEAVATALAGNGDEAARRSLASGFPTGALAMLRFETPFAGIERGAGRVEAFITPA